MDEVAGKQPVPDQEEGWFPDPEQEGQERFWDGEGWTDEVRPDGSEDPGLDHLPEHVPELQRALAAATADIDSVEDRLSALFDRSETAPGQPPRPRPPRTPRLVPAEALEQHDDGADDDGSDDGSGGDGDVLLLEDFDEEAEIFEDEDDELDAGVDDTGADDDDDDDEFADLDAALASEAPEEL
jgi:hypothetical protein